MCVFVLLSSQPRLSSMSVVFDFNDSLNDFAPVSLMPLAVYMMRIGFSHLLMDVFYVSFFHNQDLVS